MDAYVSSPGHQMPSLDSAACMPSVSRYIKEDQLSPDIAVMLLSLEREEFGRISPTALRAAMPQLNTQLILSLNPASFSFFNAIHSANRGEAQLFVQITSDNQIWVVFLDNNYRLYEQFKVVVPDGYLIKKPMNDEGERSFQCGESTVVIGSEAGGYYCEHIYFTALTLATSSTSICRNDSDEPLVGFIHIPGGSEGRQTSIEDIRIAALALRGYYEEINWQVRDRELPKILMTGFGPFLTVKQNPSGELVSERRHLEDIIKAAFPTNIIRINPELEEYSNTVGHNLLCQIYDSSGVLIGGFKLITASFPVEPGAIRGDGSIIDVLCKYNPHAVISFGISLRHTVYCLEVAATNAGMVPTAEIVRLPPNESLPRAFMDATLATRR